MKPYSVGPLTLLHGDCRNVLAEMEPCSVDAIVTDPPYGIHFMAKSWDKFGGPLGHDHHLGRERSGSMHAGEYDYSKNTAFQDWTLSWARGALRVLKPGAYMLVCGSPRTYHRMACGIEDAGFEIRDCLQWLFGSGFPKSLDVSKALDKAVGAERSVVGSKIGRPGVSASGENYGQGFGRTYEGRVDRPNPALDITAPATDLAQLYGGWGTALKPAYEPIVLARKPLAGTVAANVQQWGTGGLNIDATRIGSAGGPSGAGYGGPDDSVSAYGNGLNGRRAEPIPGLGRWPANVLLDEGAARLLDVMSGETTSSGRSDPAPGSALNGYGPGDADGWNGAWSKRGVAHADRGGASRFFYTAKTSRAEREFALDDLEPTRRSDGRETEHHVPNLRTTARRNDHPTVKPLDLMRWLVRLVTPPGGLVCDPFVGSGSTGMAALDEGFRFVGIDLEEHYLEIAQKRIARRHVLEAMPGRLL